MTQLSVNVNKIAVLRNSRGGYEPDPARFARAALDAGAHGITVHPRPDQRHIRVTDIGPIAAILGDAELNIEGNPFAPARDGYPGLIAIVADSRPAQATLVPDGDGQITSDHGFDLARDAQRLRPLIAELRRAGCRVSLFVDAGCADVERAAEIGAERIEIYTGPFAQAHARGDAARALAQCLDTAQRARKVGLGINAGHDLNQHNLGELLAAAGFIDEVSIGHALFAEALVDGLATTVGRYLNILARADR